MKLKMRIYGSMRLKMDRKKFLKILAVSFFSVSLSSSLTQAQESMTESKKTWENLTPEEKQNLAEKYKRFKEKSPEEKTRLKESLKRFKSLSPDEKKRIK